MKTVQPSLLAVGITLFAGLVMAQPQSPGQRLFQSKCESCHSAEGGPPAISARNVMPAERIFATLITGTMKDAVADMTSRERRTVAEFLGQRP